MPDEIPFGGDPYAVNLQTNRDAIARRDPKHYTIFDPRNVYRHDLPELAELTRAAGKTYPEEVISYRPERRTLHSLAARINLYAKTSTDEEYGKLVERIYRNYVLPTMGETVGRIDAERKKIEGQPLTHYPWFYDASVCRMKSIDLLKSGRELLIEHGDQIYRLIKTSNDKLLLVN